uniref:Uncharacterized protein n=1 Tax=Alexandrium catenella TaxID=2925 RepID=A0A7S1QL54_ALECA|eukprot:CAMPEP_0171195412 /NCGR_PEP_ID=MMETSP0790-20130122/21384_1 /TAXON_ID=2925 /ORGANISM="Alexandrium catenella, Strain OF101" /LENGTH=202 /DNA_ID=CAMNT_0011660625 /DNA_START=93 /DNA_END=701 /DNA_ORIENTATION=+
MALRTLMLLMALSVRVDADSVLEIISELKTFRDGAVELMGNTAATLKEQGSASEAQRVKQWSEDWLSILGVNKGLTGLAKDFVLNYLGRSAYHDSNGPLIDSIKRVASAFPRGGEGLDDEDVAGLRYRLVDVCKEGKKLFKEGGSLNQMLQELQSIVSATSSNAALKKGLNENSQLRNAFVYFSGSRPTGSDDDPDFDEGEL